MTAGAALSLEGVSKHFEGQRALDNVRLNVARGEVHALMGQNGSGKSTLIKTLAGYFHPERGANGSFLDEPFRFGSPGWCEERGIRFIHQDLGLVPGLSVIDNLALGHGYRSRLWINWQREIEHAEDEFARFGTDLDVRRHVSTLGLAQRTMVAIVRALQGWEEERGHLLVLDEPTAALPRSEIRHLFAAIRRVREQGGSVLYVSHRLEEVFEIADRVSVLRDGRLVATEPVADLDHDSLIELMLGGAIGETIPAPPSARAERAMEIRDLSGEVVRGASFDLHRGEVLGVSGMVGSGLEELPYLIAGAAPSTSGTIEVAGHQPSRPSFRRVARLGVGLVPGDRMRRCVIPTMTVRENITLPSIPSKSPLRWIDVASERRDATKWLGQLGVQPSGPELPMTSLSGGNQQKTVLARSFRTEPKILLMHEPAHGVDIGAKKAIFADITGAATTGMAVLICSVDEEDLAAACDRVLVLRDGHIVAELEGQSLTPDSIVRESLIVRSSQ